MKAKLLGLLSLLLLGCAGEPEGEEEALRTSELDPNVSVESMFAEPDGVKAHKDALLQRVKNMIDVTEEGDTIRVALFSIGSYEDGPKVLKALKDAVDRKVKVQIIQNGEDPNDTEHKSLANKLGANHRFCGQTGKAGCMSAKGSSLMHSKLFLFSRTKDAGGQWHKNVSWVGSANMTEQTGAATYNNALAIYDDKDLYDQLGSYWSGLWKRQQNDSDFYNQTTKKGFYVSNASNTVVHASPNLDGNLVAARLKEVTPSPGCVVAIAQNRITDNVPEIVDELRRIAKPSDPNHCDVNILVKHYNDGNILQKLRALGAKVKTIDTHDKLFLVDAKFNGSAQRRKLVFAGSHNWTKSANDLNDELLIRIENAAVYQSYADYVFRQWLRATDI